MARYRADVRVLLREGVLDPQGQAVAGALRALGFSGVAEVRVGRWIRLELEASSEEEARRQVAEMGRRLLANPVIEDFAFEVVPLPGPGGGEAPEPAGREAAGLGSPLNPRAAARGLDAPAPRTGADAGAPGPAREGGSLPGSPGLPPLPPPPGGGG